MASPTSFRNAFGHAAQTLLHAQKWTCELWPIQKRLFLTNNRELRTISLSASDENEFKTRLKLNIFQS